MRLKNLYGLYFRCSQGISVGELDRINSKSNLNKESGVSVARTECASFIIDKDVANVLHFFRDGRTPNESTGFSEVCPPPRLLAAMVADGLLDIRSSNGQYVNGAAALEDIFESAESLMLEPQGTIAKLSEEAVRHTIRFSKSSEETLTESLYSYNTKPFSVALAERVGRFSDFNEWIMHASDLGTPYDRSNSYWLYWDFATRKKLSEITQKVYLGVAPHHLPEAVAIILKLASSLQLPAFKVANNTKDIMRPDKLVLYCNDAKHRSAVVAACRPHFDQVESHPVPFSCGENTAGTISWAREPEENFVSEASEHRSWRAHICRVMASFIAKERHKATGERALQHAINGRIYLEGINPITWNYLDDD